MKDRLTTSKSLPLRKVHITRKASLVVALSMGALLATTTPSFAGTSTHLRVAGGSSYCSLLAVYTKKQTAANKALETPGGAVAAMKAAFKALNSEESLVLSVAPSTLQTPYKNLFKELNVFYTDLSKVGFNYAKLSKAQIASFTAISKSMAASTTKITAYDKKVCGVKD